MSADECTAAMPVREFDRGRYWHAHFAGRHGEVDSSGTARSLDYPNDRLRLQIYAHVFEAAGPLDGKDVLDVGCGWGSCALMVHACGAHVTAVDIVPETIARLTVAYPMIDWVVADLTNEADVSGLPEADCLIAAEVLQHLTLDTAISSLWSHVRPGGRFVGSIPNRECPIIQKVTERFEGYFEGASVSDLSRLARALPNLRDFWVKALAFRSDQRFLPYCATDWTKEVPGVPNRLVFTLLRDQTPA